MKNQENLISILIPVLVMVFVQTNNLAFLIFSLIMSVIYLNTPQVLYPVMFMTSLNTNYFIIKTGLSCGLVFTLLLILSLTLKIISSEERLSRKYLGWVVVLITFNLIMSFFSITGSYSSFFIMLENLLLLLLIGSQKKFDIQSLILSLVYAIVICVAIMMWAFLSGRMIETYGGRLTTFGVNENGMAMVYSQCSVVLIFAFFYLKDKLSKVICITSFFIAIYLLLLTGSRSAMFGSLAGAISVIVFFNLIVKSNRRYIFPLLLICLLSYIALDFVLNSDLQVMDRFTLDNIVEGRGTHRLERREYLLKYIFPEHPFLGVGLGGENEYAISPGPCHNIIIDPIIQIGLLGVLLYWCFIVKLLAKTRKYIHQYGELVLPVSLFVACFVNGMGEVVFFEKFFWNSIAMCVLFSNILPYNQSVIK